MDKHAWWKWLILAAAICTSVALVYPPSQRVRLGLDLKGGTSFVVKVADGEIPETLRRDHPDWNEEQVQAGVRQILEGAQGRALDVLRNRLDSLGVDNPVVYPGKDNRITIQLPGVDELKRGDAERSILSIAFLTFRMVHERNDDLIRQLFGKGQAPRGFRLVAIGSQSYFERDTVSVKDAEMDTAFWKEIGRFEVPDREYELLLEKEEQTGRIVYQPYFVKRRPELTGENLKTANVDYRAMGQPVVDLEFDSRGSALFANVTRDHAPGGSKNPNLNQTRQLAIVLDGKVYSAPVIREAIYGGRAEISGSFTISEANLLSSILRAGALPAPLEIVERRFIAPTLGADSISSGIKASLIGGVSVVIFMALYYLLPGLIADLALLLNLLLLPLGMVISAGFLGIFIQNTGVTSGVQLPVLTLPGIAGIVLSLGMAVDANVLIFERIREEVAGGKRFWSAVEAGFDRAFITIMDSNLTTLLTAVIMFIFGSGPVRGFAVTLSAGIIVSVYTAVFVTKMVFGLMANKATPRALTMLQMVRTTTIDFVGKRQAAAVLSVAVIVGSCGYLAYQGISHPSKVMGVDFTGGSSLTYTFTEKVPVDMLRKTLAGVGLSEVDISYQREVEAGGREYLAISVGSGAVGGLSMAEVAKQELVQRYPAAGLTLTQEENVGPQIGREMKLQAVWALTLAMGGMILYLSWRFHFGFALGAVVAIFHDVLVTAGLYVMMGGHLNLTIVAALLTIVGYSVNDTIVIFDRIREDLRLIRDKNLTEICNLSLNQTLSRTILTSLTLFLTTLALLVFGGGAIYDFALAMCIGVIAGTYSTIFIATPVVIAWYKGRRPEFAPAKI